MMGWFYKEWHANACRIFNLTLRSLSIFFHVGYCMDKRRIPHSLKSAVMSVHVSVFPVNHRMWHWCLSTWLKSDSSWHPSMHKIKQILVIYPVMSLYLVRWYNYTVTYNTVPVSWPHWGTGNTQRPQATAASLVWTTSGLPLSLLTCRPVQPSCTHHSIPPWMSCSPAPHAGSCDCRRPPWRWYRVMRNLWPGFCPVFVAHCCQTVCLVAVPRWSLLERMMMMMRRIWLVCCVYCPFCCDCQRHFSCGEVCSLSFRRLGQISEKKNGRIIMALNGCTCCSLERNCQNIQ